MSENSVTVEVFIVVQKRPFTAQKRRNVIAANVVLFVGFTLQWSMSRPLLGLILLNEKVS